MFITIAEKGIAVPSDEIKKNPLKVNYRKGEHQTLYLSTNTENPGSLTVTTVYYIDLIASIGEGKNREDVTIRTDSFNGATFTHPLEEILNTILEGEEDEDKRKEIRVAFKNYNKHIAAVNYYDKAMAKLAELENNGAEQVPSRDPVTGNLITPVQYAKPAEITDKDRRKQERRVQKLMDYFNTEVISDDQFDIDELDRNTVNQLRAKFVNMVEELNDRIYGVEISSEPNH